MSSLSEAPTPVPAGAVAVPDTPYVPRPGDENVEVPPQELVDEKKAETIQPALTHDDKEAIDTSNIIGERTRHARPLSGTYQIPGDEEGLPVEFVETSDSDPVDENMDENVDENLTEDVDMVEDGKVNVVEAEGANQEEGEKGNDEHKKDVGGEIDEEMDMGVVTIK